MNKLRTYSDGGARGNPGPGAIGVLVCDDQGEILEQHEDLLGVVTNNVAEYCALIAALELARVMKAKEVVSFMDSELVVRQMEGRYRIKSDHIRKLYEEAKNLEKKFKKVSYTHLPRTHEKMKLVDKMVNQALNRGGH
jgi:ribonuclease HI